MSKGKCMYDSLKIHKIIFEILVKKIFEKYFFRPKIFENPIFLAKSSINLVSLQSSMGVGMRAIAQNDRNTTLLKWATQFFKISPPPQKSKNRFFRLENGNK